MKDQADLLYVDEHQKLKIAPTRPKISTNLSAQLAPFCSNETLYEILALSKLARLGLNPFSLGVRRWIKNIHYQKTFYKPSYGLALS